MAVAKEGGEYRVSSIVNDKKIVEQYQSGAEACAAFIKNELEDIRTS